MNKEWRAMKVALQWESFRTHLVTCCWLSSQTQQAAPLLSKKLHTGSQRRRGSFACRKQAAMHLLRTYFSYSPTESINKFFTSLVYSRNPRKLRAQIKRSWKPDAYLCYDFEEKMLLFIARQILFKSSSFIISLSITFTLFDLSNTIH